MGEVMNHKPKKFPKEASSCHRLPGCVLPQIGLHLKLSQLGALQINLVSTSSCPSYKTHSFKSVSTMNPWLWKSGLGATLAEFHDVWAEADAVDSDKKLFEQISLSAKLATCPRPESPPKHVFGHSLPG